MSTYAHTQVHTHEPIQTHMHIVARENRIQEGITRKSSFLKHVRGWKTAPKRAQ